MRRLGPPAALRILLLPVLLILLVTQSSPAAAQTATSLIQIDALKNLPPPVSLPPLSTILKIRITRLRPGLTEAPLTVTRLRDFWRISPPSNAGGASGAPSSFRSTPISFKAMDVLFMRLSALAPKGSRRPPTAGGAHEVLFETTQGNPSLYWADSTSAGDEVGGIAADLLAATEEELKKLVIQVASGQFGVPLAASKLPLIGTDRAGPFCSYQPLSPKRFVPGEAGFPKFSRLPSLPAYGSAAARGTPGEATLQTVCEQPQRLTCDLQPPKPTFDSSCKTSQLDTRSSPDGAPLFSTFYPEEVAAAAPALKVFLEEFQQFTKDWQFKSLCLKSPLQGNLPDAVSQCWAAFTTWRKPPCNAISTLSETNCRSPHREALRALWNQTVTPEKKAEIEAGAERIRLRYRDILLQRRQELSQHSRAKEILAVFDALLTAKTDLFHRYGPFGPAAAPCPPQPVIGDACHSRKPDLEVLLDFDSVFKFSPAFVFPGMINAAATRGQWGEIHTTPQKPLTTARVALSLGHLRIHGKSANPDLLYSTLAHEIAHLFDPGTVTHYLREKLIKERGLTDTVLDQSRKFSITAADILPVIHAIFGNDQGTKPTGLLGCLRQRFVALPEDPVGLRLRAQRSDAFYQEHCRRHAFQENVSANRKRCETYFRTTHIYDALAFPEFAALDVQHFQQDPKSGRAMAGEAFADFMTGYALRARSCDEKRIANGQFAAMSDLRFADVSHYVGGAECDLLSRNQRIGFDEHPAGVYRAQIKMLNFDYRRATNCAPLDAEPQPSVDCSFTAKAVPFADPEGCEASRPLGASSPSAPPPGDVPLENTVWRIVSWDSVEALRGIWTLNALQQAPLCNASGNCSLQFKGGTQKFAYLWVGSLIQSFALYSVSGDQMTFNGVPWGGRTFTAVRSFESDTRMTLRTPAGKVQLVKDP
jgi:hypothetical protein